MNQREQTRLRLMNSVIAEEVSLAEAARLMALSERQVRRLLAAYRRDGARALAHGNRGRRPRNALPEGLEAQVVRLAAEQYPGANHSHLTELLEEREGLRLSRSTVRRMLLRAGIASPRRRRPPRHRVRRERMPRAGMLLQLDGSHHAWLEERGPRFVLLLAVDDATGVVAAARFRPAEDARGYFQLMEQVIGQFGLPLALYTDRHAVFQPVGKRSELPGATTQFARAMRELGISQIFARSPQAKGRVERIAGTFQDRLVTELRLARASTISEAQALLDQFLPRFNARFAVSAAVAAGAWRAVDPGVDLTAVLGFRHVRTVARDNTVKYGWRTLQLLPGTERTSYAGARVEVMERPDGELAVYSHGLAIANQLAPPRAGRLREPRAQLARSPALERVASGLSSGGVLPRPSQADSVAGAHFNGHARLRPPTPRQQARWKAIRQAQLEGLSMRATAELLGISRNTVRRYLAAGGPPQRGSELRSSANGAAE